MRELTVIPITGMPEVRAGDDLAQMIASAHDDLRERDVVVVAHKAVSKAEGRVVAQPDRLAAAKAESKRILRRAGDTVISETRHGFVCANAGVDASNVEAGHVALLPLDPDLSARRLRAGVAHHTGTDVGIAISDTFGRAWRLGQTNVAIGVAGFDPFMDYEGDKDTFGRELVATRICVADELAGAAEIVMGKTRRICAAIVRGAELRWAQGAAIDIVRPYGSDFFR